TQHVGKKGLDQNLNPGRNMPYIVHANATWDWIVPRARCATVTEHARAQGFPAFRFAMAQYHNRLCFAMQYYGEVNATETHPQCARGMVGPQSP
ncbi:MAG: hypothetical protein ACKPKO_60520, partial [Candidatus Fonsibacter sp.]